MQFAFEKRLPILYETEIPHIWCSCNNLRLHRGDTLEDDWKYDSNNIYQTRSHLEFFIFLWGIHICERDIYKRKQGLVQLHNTTKQHLRPLSHLFTTKHCSALLELPVQRLWMFGFNLNTLKWQCCKSICVTRLADLLKCNLVFLCCPNPFWSTFLTSGFVV